MTAQEVLEAARSLGATFRLESGEISVQAASPLPDLLMRELRQHKPAILALLAPEPAPKPYSLCEVITSLARLQEVAVQADRVQVEPVDLTNYGDGTVTEWQPLSAAQVEGHALLSCVCPKSIGPALSADCCPACEMAMTCPDCEKCRGCSLMLRIDSFGPPDLRKKAEVRKSRTHEADEDEH